MATKKPNAEDKPGHADDCKPEWREYGKGLLDGSGKYTEPGAPIIYCDSGWDD